MKISRRQLQKIILENLLLEGTAMPLEKVLLILSPSGGYEAAISGTLTRNHNSFNIFKKLISSGIADSTGKVRKGADAIAYITHRVLPRIYQSQGMTAGSATSVKNTLTFLQHYAKTPGLLESLAKYRPVSGPNYIGRLYNTKMGQSILNMMPKAAQSTQAGIRTLEAAGALKAPAAQITKAVQAAKPAARAITTASQAMKVTLNTSPEAVALAKELGRKYATSGAALSKTPGASQAAEKLAVEGAKQGSKFATFFSLLGKAAVVLMVVDAFYQPYNLFANGELWGFKLGLGVKDMDTPWGQLTYRRKRLGNPPAKPSDFNNEYRNLIATIIWNQRNSGEAGKIAKEWTQRAIKEDLIDLPKWKAYIAPWREAADEIKKAEKALVAEEENDAGDLDDLGLVDEAALADLGEDTGEKFDSDVGKPEKQAQKGKKSISSEKISKIQKIIGERGDGKWSKDTNIKLGAYVTAADPAVITTPTRLEWWKDWKNSAPKIENISVGGRTMSFGTAANPQLRGNLSSLLKVIEFIDESRKNASSEVNESLSHGALIRKRYWGRY